MSVEVPELPEELKKLLRTDTKPQFKKGVDLLIKSLQVYAGSSMYMRYPCPDGSQGEIGRQLVLESLQQASEAQTIDRSKYYIKRLLKALFEVKTSALNDINLRRWQEYDDLLTDSLWLFDKRDSSGVHTADYWGNFIPQIPYQLITRFTKEGDWVLDPFAGGGTTLIEAKRLKRNALGIELLPNIAEKARERLISSNSLFTGEYTTEIINAEAASCNYKNELAKLGTESVQLVIFHPPYWNVIQFSDDTYDLSNKATLDEYLNGFADVLDNALSVLDNKRYFAIIIGDMYSKGQWIPLGFHLMNLVLERQHYLKSIVVKNYEDTRAKMKEKQLWRYRALVGGFYVFKHEYILIFQKKKGKRQSKAEGKSNLKTDPPIEK